MAYINSYQTPPPLNLTPEELYGPEPYDLNFVYPINIAALETPRVKLVPFVPRIHADAFWEVGSQHPELFRYYHFTWTTKEELLHTIEILVRRSPNNVLFSVIDKTKPGKFEGGSFAGVIGLFNSSPPNLSSEIGFVLVLPAFQRTHVASNAVGIMMKACLELPHAKVPGLGLRRLEWRAHGKNAASVGLAERMGFKREGLMKWHMVVQAELAAEGKKPRDDDQWPDRYGRDTWQLALSWEDWENGVEELVQTQIDRI